MIEPSTNGTNGRDSAGRFTAGNGFGAGNPFARQSARIRSALMLSVTDDDVTAIVRAMIDRAKSGDVNAARLVLERTIGRVADPVVDDDDDAPELPPKVG